MDGLFFELPVGLRINGEVHKEVELLKTNGVAEKIFVKKLSEKPFTWQGNIVSAAVKRIGNVEIGSEVRKKYLEDGAVTIPFAVLKLPLAEINTLLVEIHRRVWVSFIPKQEIICKYCGRKLVAAIRHERYFSDSIGFWRRIAMDCLLAVERVDENGNVVDTLPTEFHTWYGLKIFNEYLSGKDLRSIRNGLIEHLPTLPFAYYEPCGCDEQREIPMVMEASNFFSE